MPLAIKACKPITIAGSEGASGFYPTLEGDHHGLEQFLSDLSYDHKGKEQETHNTQNIVTFLGDSGRNVFELHRGEALIKLRGIRYLVDDTYVLLVSGQDRNRTDDVRVEECIRSNELIELMNDWSAIVERESKHV